MRKTLGAVGCLAVMIAASAAIPARAQTPAAGPWDPLESMNRAVFGFNSAFGNNVSSPLSSAYHSTVPEAVQAGVDNVFTNLREPLTAVASGLQGDMRNAGASVTRFAINTTVGILGIFDVATRMGWVSRPTDLGTTLCRYDIPDGPYIVWPFLGPSTARDSIALGATYLGTFTLINDMAPAFIVADRSVSYAADGAPAPAAATDAYAEHRDQYLARRKALCEETAPGEQLKASPLGDVIVRLPQT